MELEMKLVRRKKKQQNKKWQQQIKSIIKDPFAVKLMTISVNAGIEVLKSFIETTEEFLIKKGYSRFNRPVISNLKPEQKIIKLAEYYQSLTDLQEGYYHD